MKASDELQEMTQPKPREPLRLEHNGVDMGQITLMHTHVEPSENGGPAKHVLRVETERRAIDLGRASLREVAEAMGGDYDTIGFDPDPDDEAMKKWLAKAHDKDEPHILDVILGNDGWHEIWAYPSKRAACEFGLTYKPFSDKMKAMIRKDVARKGLIGDVIVPIDDDWGEV